MARTPPNFRLPDYRRALIGARQAGEEVERVEIKPDGTIVMVMKLPIAQTSGEAA